MIQWIPAKRGTRQRPRVGGGGVNQGRHTAEIRALPNWDDEDALRDEDCSTLGGALLSVGAGCVQ